MGSPRQAGAYVQPGIYAAGSSTFDSPSGGTGIRTVHAGSEGDAIPSTPYYQSSDRPLSADKAQLNRSASAFDLTVALRIAAVMLSLTSFFLVVFAKGINTYKSDGYSDNPDHVETQYKVVDRNLLRDTRSSKFLVAMDVIVSIYEILPSLFSCLQKVGTNTFMSSYAGTLITFILDQVLAYLVLFASTWVASLGCCYLQAHSIPPPAHFSLPPCTCTRELRS